MLELDVAPVPQRAHSQNDEDDGREEKDLREYAHSSCCRVLGDGRAEAEKALARQHDQQ
jgi:hypothetical protein